MVMESWFELMIQKSFVAASFDLILLVLWPQMMVACLIDSLVISELFINLLSINRINVLVVSSTLSWNLLDTVTALICH